MKYLKPYTLYERVSEETKLFENHSEWSEVDEKLQKEFQFDNFTKALDFINKLAEICEEMNHHPNIDWTYNKIKFTLSTHDAGDIITEKDLELASKIDNIK